jgi:plastocyanin
VASGVAFTADTLVVPAESEVTITFENQDAGVPHNLIIWETEEAAQDNDEGAKLFEISQFNGVGERDGSFTTPGVGTNYFNCTIHPTSMFGDVEVVAGG